jgi:hypothetical protein
LLDFTILIDDICNSSDSTYWQDNPKIQDSQTESSMKIV